MRTALALASSLWLFAAAAAPAPRDPESEAARGHFLAGQRLYRRGQFREALGRFEQAYRIKPNGVVLYNIGRCQERLGDLRSAMRSYQGYLREVLALLSGRPLHRGEGVGDRGQGIAQLVGEHGEELVLSLMLDLELTNQTRGVEIRVESERHRHSARVAHRPREHAVAARIAYDLVEKERGRWLAAVVDLGERADFEVPMRPGDVLQLAKALDARNPLAQIDWPGHG